MIYYLAIMGEMNDWEKKGLGLEPFGSVLLGLWYIEGHIYTCTCEGFFGSHRTDYVGLFLGPSSDLHTYLGVMIIWVCIHNY
jgi:hypothetical protein